MITLALKPSAETRPSQVDVGETHLTSNQSRQLPPSLMEVRTRPANPEITMSHVMWPRSAPAAVDTILLT